MLKDIKFATDFLNISMLFSKNPILPKRQWNPLNKETPWKAQMKVEVTIN